MLVSLGELQHEGKQNPVELFVRLTVEVGRPGLELLPNEGVEVDFSIKLALGVARFAWACVTDSGRNAGTSTVPLACSSDCLSTLCNSRTLPGHE